MRTTRRALCGALLLVIHLFGQEKLRAQAAFSIELPDAPRPQLSSLLPSSGFDQGNSGGEPVSAAADASQRNQENGPNPENWNKAQNRKTASARKDQEQEKNEISPGFPPVRRQPAGMMPIPAESRTMIPASGANCLPAASTPAARIMSCNPRVNPYSRFLDYSGPFPLTPRQKLILAYKNVTDPFNFLTIAGTAAFSIGTDSHTAYGPGFHGFAKYAGISFTDDAVGEFFGTFLIPSLAHQDPHYRRLPNLSLRRRFFHAIDSVVLSQGDDGHPMFNYAVVFGTIGTSALGNLYVPGRDTSWGSSAARVSVALATDPIGNIITEFLPDVAEHINFNVLLVQRIINRVALAEGAGPTE